MQWFLVHRSPRSREKGRDTVSEGKIVSMSSAGVCGVHVLVVGACRRQSGLVLSPPGLWRNRNGLIANCGNECWLMGKDFSILFTKRCLDGAFPGNQFRPDVSTDRGRENTAVKAAMPSPSGENTRHEK